VERPAVELAFKPFNQRAVVNLAAIIWMVPIKLGASDVRRIGVTKFESPDHRQVACNEDENRRRSGAEPPPVGVGKGVNPRNDCCRASNSAISSAFGS
jgi:hypothetical protein